MDQESNIFTQQPTRDGRVSSWINPAEPPGGLRGVLSLARDRIWVVLAVLALVLGGSFAAWRSVARTYQAEALLATSSLPAGDSVYRNLPLLRDGGGGLTRDVETVARLVKTDVAAEQVRTQTKSAQTAHSLLASIDAGPVGQSFLVSSRASATNPTTAAKLANAFAAATLDGLTKRFLARVSGEEAIVRRQLSELSAPEGLNSRQAGVRRAQQRRADLRGRLIQLQALENTPDPTVRLATNAQPPTSASSPGLPLVLLSALLGGLALGIGSAMLLAALDSRVRGERQLRASYSLPVSARIPTDRSRHRIASVSSAGLDIGVADGFRMIRQNALALRRNRDRPRSMLFTSAASREGRTTASVNTAVALAESDQRVLLVDLDLRKPSLAAVFGVAAPAGVLDVLRSDHALGSTVVPVPVTRGALDVLVHTPDHEPTVPDQLAPSDIDSLLRDAHADRYDFVVFDAPQLGTVSDALSIATQVDDVYILVWRRRTLKKTLADLAAICQEHGVFPRGFVLIGGRSGSRDRHIAALR